MANVVKQGLLRAGLTSSTAMTGPRPQSATATKAPASLSSPSTTSTLGLISLDAPCKRLRYFTIQSHLLISYAFTSTIDWRVKHLDSIETSSPTTTSRINEVYNETYMSPFVSQPNTAACNWSLRIKPGNHDCSSASFAVDALQLIAV